MLNRESLGNKYFQIVPEKPAGFRLMKRKENPINSFDGKADPVYCESGKL
jgi:hypothetical protein